MVEGTELAEEVSLRPGSHGAARRVRESSSSSHTRLVCTVCLVLSFPGDAACARPRLLVRHILLITTVCAVGGALFQHTHLRMPAEDAPVQPHGALLEDSSLFIKESSTIGADAFRSFRLAAANYENYRPQICGVLLKLSDSLHIILSDLPRSLFCTLSFHVLRSWKHALPAGFDSSA